MLQVEECSNPGAIPNVLTTFDTKADVDVSSDGGGEGRGGLSAPPAGWWPTALAPCHARSCLASLHSCVQGICASMTMDGCDQCSGAGRTSFAKCSDPLSVISTLCLGE